MTKINVFASKFAHIASQINYSDRFLMLRMKGGEKEKTQMTLSKEQKQFFHQFC
jgi:hypothetical protein